MNHSGRLRICIGAVLLLMASAAVWSLTPALDANAQEQKPSITLVKGKTPFFQVSGLDGKLLSDWQQKKPTREQWEGLFAVQVQSEQLPSVRRPALIGAYYVEAGHIIFAPRYPLEPGLHYRASLDLTPLGAGDTRPIVGTFEIAKVKESATTAVAQVYPTRNDLPENQLKFYIHFSAPMSRGEAYKHIHLLNSQGRTIAFPFLELDEELWNPEGKRFTLFFDPGRIKRGLKPREEAGPSLEEGKKYTLVIDSNWADARGNQLKAEFRKVFSVRAPDDVSPDHRTWKVAAPASNTQNPFIVTFPESLDHALLQRLLWIVNVNGDKIPGTVAVSKHETSWQFRPDYVWRAGKYRLVVDTTLEDLAGNSIAKPFEIDVFKKVERKVESTTVDVGFSID